VSAFVGLPEQPYAARLLDAALERPAHAYLLSGPAGSGKRRYADRFAAAVLDTELGRVERRTHPDLFVLEPEGQGILVEGARRLRRDLYLRPYEAGRRVYLILDAHLLRDESANALLKSIEEPPEYGVFVLVSDHAGRMLPTILSRVQTVPFRRFPAGELERIVGSIRSAWSDTSTSTPYSGGSSSDFRSAFADSSRSRWASRIRYTRRFASNGRRCRSRRRRRAPSIRMPWPSGSSTNRSGCVRVSTRRGGQSSRAAANRSA